MAPWGVTPEQTARMERHAVYTFRGRWAKSWKQGNVFLAGDAAHLMPPFLGQGLCAGLAGRSSAQLAAEHGAPPAEATPEVLETYGPERTGHVQHIIDEAVAAGRVICELDVDRAAARDAELREQTTPIPMPPSPASRRILAWAQPSLTDGRAGAPTGGSRRRAGSGCSGRVGLFDDIVGGGWQLISRIADPAELLSEEDASWFRQIGGVVADLSEQGPISDLDGDYRRWFTEHGCEAFLARPDFYVFAAGQHTDLPHYVSQLRQLLAPTATEGK